MKPVFSSNSSALYLPFDIASIIGSSSSERRPIPASRSLALALGPSRARARREARARESARGARGSRGRGSAH